MPWLQEAKKDVESCEKLRGTARTQGTETSKYLQEEKEISMSGVVAIETDRAQTGSVTARPGL